MAAGLPKEFVQAMHRATEVFRAESAGSLSCAASLANILKNARATGMINDDMIAELVQRHQALQFLRQNATDAYTALRDGWLE